MLELNGAEATTLADAIKANQTRGRLDGIGRCEALACSVALPVGDLMKLSPLVTRLRR